MGKMHGKCEKSEIKEQEKIGDEQRDDDWPWQGIISRKSDAPTRLCVTDPPRRADLVRSAGAGDPVTPLKESRSVPPPRTAEIGFECPSPRRYLPGAPGQTGKASTHHAAPPASHGAHHAVPEAGRGRGGPPLRPARPLVHLPRGGAGAGRRPRYSKGRANLVLVEHEPGMLGISETSPDVRDLLARQHNDIRVAKAIDLLCHPARKWIGARAATSRTGRFPPRSERTSARQGGESCPGPMG